MSEWQKLKNRVLRAAYVRPIRPASHTRGIIEQLVSDGFLRRVAVNGQAVKVMRELTEKGKQYVERLTENGQ